MTPNVTELCLLTDYDYDKIQNISETGDREALFLEVSKAAGRLLDSGVSEVIVTGVLFEEQDAAKECTVGKETGTGGRKVANLTVTREKNNGRDLFFYRGKLLGNRRSVRFRNCRRKRLAETVQKIRSDWRER